jgi:hypothetical protein
MTLVGGRVVMRENTLIGNAGGKAVRFLECL